MYQANAVTKIRPTESIAWIVSLGGDFENAVKLFKRDKFPGDAGLWLVLLIGRDFDASAFDSPTGLLRDELGEIGFVLGRGKARPEGQSGQGN